MNSKNGYLIQKEQKKQKEPIITYAQRITKVQRLINFINEINNNNKYEILNFRYKENNNNSGINIAYFDIYYNGIKITNNYMDSNIRDLCTELAEELWFLNGKNCYFDIISGTLKIYV